MRPPIQTDLNSICWTDCIMTFAWRFDLQYFFNTGFPVRTENTLGSPQWYSLSYTETLKQLSGKLWKLPQTVAGGWTSEHFPALGGILQKMTWSSWEKADKRQHSVISEQKGNCLSFLSNEKRDEKSLRDRVTEQTLLHWRNLLK